MWPFADFPYTLVTWLAIQEPYKVCLSHFSAGQNDSTYLGSAALPINHASCGSKI